MELDRVRLAIGLDWIGLEWIILNYFGDGRRQENEWEYGYE